MSLAYTGAWTCAAKHRVGSGAIGLEACAIAS